MYLMGEGTENIVTLVWGNAFLLFQNLLVLLVMVAMMLFTIRNSMWMCIFPFAMMIFDGIVFYFRAPDLSDLYDAFLAHEK